MRKELLTSRHQAAGNGQVQEKEDKRCPAQGGGLTGTSEEPGWRVARLA